MHKVLYAFAYFLGLFYASESGTFTVDYNNHVFLKDGQPFRYISGSIHYFRVHPDYWQDRLHRIRALGLNAITTYVPWNLHEPMEGTYDFSGGLNLTQFLTIAQQNDLYVLLRPGPYIDAEFEFGGFPWWLLNYDGIELRTWNKIYTDKVQAWFNYFLPIVKPFLYENGGPILMAQVENEYGAVGGPDREGNCDKTYTTWLRDLLHTNLGNETLLYTTDNGDNNRSIACGRLNDTVTTVDFGTTSDSNIAYVLFRYQDMLSGGAPHTCSEFWVIWFSMWGDPNPHTWGWNGWHPLSLLDQNINWMYYNLSANWNFYMIHGGTNFGFHNGDGNPNPVTTSYDYTAAISENGAFTDTAMVIYNFIKGIPNWPNPPLAVPNNNTILAYGSVPLTRVGSNLISTLTQIQEPCVQSTNPLSFEQIKHGHGYVIYTNTLTSGGMNLSTPNIRDYGYVYLNNVYQGMLIRTNKTSITINAKAGDILRILVENCGRMAAGVLDFKGLNVNGTKFVHPPLLSNATVTLDGVTLTNWYQCGINLTKAAVGSLTASFDKKSEENSLAVSQPGVFTGTFTSNQLEDTFFDSTGWGKGQLFINGYNLGRYWASLGPQMTLYIPKPYIQQTNKVTLIELQGGSSTTANFVDHKIWVYNS